MIFLLAGSQLRLPIEVQVAYHDMRPLQTIENRHMQVAGTIHSAPQIAKRNKFYEMFSAKMEILMAGSAVFYKKFEKLTAMQVACNGSIGKRNGYSSAWL
jgi:hypothetical protein